MLARTGPLAIPDSKLQISNKILLYVICNLEYLESVICNLKFQ